LRVDEDVVVDDDEDVVVDDDADATHVPPDEQIGVEDK